MNASNVRKLDLPPAYMRAGEVQEWSVALALPSYVLGFDGLAPDIWVEKIKIGQRTFEGDSLAASASYLAIPGDGGVTFTFRNASENVLKREGKLLIDQSGIGPVIPRTVDAATDATNPAAKETAPDPLALSEEVLFTPERESPSSARSNHYACRLTPGQARVIRDLLMGRPVHHAERESVRIAFERGMPR